MDRELIFAVDVDCVLRDNLIELLNVYNKHFNENRTLESITDYKTDISFPRIEKELGISAGEWFFRKHSKELFVNAKPFPNVAEDIEKLHNIGKVVIVTYQKTTTNKSQTLRWLKKYKINYDGLCFLKDKTLLNCDYLIDDNDWNFIGSNAKHGILINAPYNKNINLNDLKNKSNCEDIIRCDSLHEFVSKIEKKIEK